MIKAVIFDCFGVLTADRWLAFVDKLPKEKDTEELHAVHRAYNNGILTEGDFHDQVKEITGQDFEDSLKLASSDIVKNDAVLSYIRDLRSRGIKIGLLSNVASNWIRDQLLDPEEQSLFDEMVLSYEVGVGKPDPRIFQIVCERLAVEPREAVLIDDVERFCFAAEAEGLTAIHFKNFKDSKLHLEKMLNDSD